MWHPPEQDRIREHTPAAVNQQIDDATRLAYERAQTEPEIRARLRKLEREWHLDRALIATFSVVGAITASGAIRSAWRGKRFSVARLLFWTQMGFLLNHAVRGWCPPVAVLRRLGIRSSNEIAAERAALEKKLAGVP